MKCINSACQLRSWPRVFVLVILTSLNLTPVRAQDFIPQRTALPCFFCKRPGPPGYHWNEIATNILLKNNITGPRSANRRLAVS